MIDIKRKEDCCGCNACGDACAHEAITFKTDNEGFWYPEIDKENVLTVDYVRRFVLFYMRNM